MRCSFLVVKSLLRYLLIAVAIMVVYAIITPSSFGSWVLYFVIAAVAAGVIEAAYRRFVA